MTTPGLECRLGERFFYAFNQKYIKRPSFSYSTKKFFLVKPIIIFYGSNEFMSKPNPNYYSVIIAPVRYCKNLASGAKLLYGEISALCNHNGSCVVTNRFFADLFDVDVRTISRWIASLSENKFIVCDIQKKGIDTTRRIYLNLPEGDTSNESKPKTIKKDIFDKSVVKKLIKVSNGIYNISRKNGNH